MDEGAISRRVVLNRFLLGAGCFAVTADGARTQARARMREVLPPSGVAFPQGVASGDPQPDGVLLWTRAVPAAPVSLAEARAPVPLLLQVAADAAFTEPVAAHGLEARAHSDHTVRVFVDGLDPATDYYYRFVAGPAVSRVGRTRTAPAPDDRRPIRLATVSCQNYTTGYYSAYRRMIVDDEARPPEERLALVLHLGDFIYDTLGPKASEDRTGLGWGDVTSVRALPPPPPHAPPLMGQINAQSLDDYRHLYKVYLSDPDLQEARARWPFVCTWDDHEFTNDCWQSMNPVGGKDFEGIPSQRRRVAASRAWSEYIPALLTQARGIGGVAPHAHDFTPHGVEDAAIPSSAPLSEPNNRKAISAITIYRALSLGAHADLILSDLRSYRSDHAVPEADNPLMVGRRGLVPVDLLDILDAGRQAGGGTPPGRVSTVLGTIDNPRADRAPGTMMGARQKAWWKASMAASRATWRLWASSVPVMPLRFDFGRRVPALGDVAVSSDAWEGYPGERRELLASLAQDGQSNVLALSGDHHAAIVGLLGKEPGRAGAPVLAEIVTPAISSTSMYYSVRKSGGLRAAPLTWFRDLGDAAGAGADAPVDVGLGRDRVNLNTTFLWGVEAALAASTTRVQAFARLFRNPDQNPHLRFIDTAANGYTVVRLDGEAAHVEHVVLARPMDPGPDGQGHLRYRALFRLGREDGVLAVDGPVFEGVPPDPFG